MTIHLFAIYLFVLISFIGIACLCLMIDSNSKNRTYKLQDRVVLWQEADIKIRNKAIWDLQERVKTLENSSNNTLEYKNTQE